MWQFGMLEFLRCPWYDEYLFFYHSKFILQKGFIEFDLEFDEVVVVSGVATAVI